MFGNVCGAQTDMCFYVKELADGGAQPFVEVNKERDATLEEGCEIIGIVFKER